MAECYTKLMAKDLVIFDGSNFYHGSKNLSSETHLTNFDYIRLVEIITGSKNFKNNHFSTISKNRRLK